MTNTNSMSLLEWLEYGIANMKEARSKLREDNSEQAIQFDKLTGAISFGETVKARVEEIAKKIEIDFLNNDFLMHENVLALIGQPKND